MPKEGHLYEVVYVVVLTEFRVPNVLCGRFDGGFDKTGNWSMKSPRRVPSLTDRGLLKQSCLFIKFIRFSPKTFYFSIRDTPLGCPPGIHT